MVDAICSRPGPAKRRCTARCSLAGAYVVEDARLTALLGFFRFGFGVKLLGDRISRTETIGDLEIFPLVAEVRSGEGVQFSQIEDPRARVVMLFPGASMMPAELK